MAKKKARAVGRGLTTLAVVIFFVNASLIGATGQAQALDAGECAKDVVTGAWTETVLDYVMGNPNHCLEIAESDFSNQSRVDLMASMETVHSQNNQTLSAVQNRLQDSSSIALTKAKITIVNELNNGSTRQEAADAANVTIENYYTGMEREVYVAWDTALRQARYMAETEYAETGSRANWISNSWGSFSGMNHNLAFIANDTRNMTVTLINGTTYDSDYIFHYGDWENQYYAYAYHPSSETPSSWPVGQSLTEENAAQANVYTVDLEGNQSNVIISQNFRDVNNEIQSQNTQAKANIYTYVDSIYNHYTAGELNTTDLLGPSEIYQEASTNRNSTGYQGWAAIQLASLGYGGDPETSHEIEANDGTTISGTLFYTADDIDSLQTGTEYDPANFNGSFLVAAQNDSNAEVVELTEPFTITAATNLVTGAEVDNTTMEKKVYAQTSAEELDAELDRLRELRQELDNQSTFASGGGSGGGGGGFDLGLGLGSGGLVVAVVLVLAVLAARG